MTRFRARFLLVGGLLGVAGSIALACGGNSAPPPTTAKSAPGGTKDQAAWPADDKSLCDWHNKPELEVSETSGPGALKPNVRRVYKSFAETETTSHHKSLVCREIDTNLDGIKDVVRTFNAKGEAQHEEADTNYDGKVDVWMNFVQGRLAEENVDTNHDGKPDVWKVYANGQLSRIKRDRNQDGKPDVWEIYTRGTLERAGVDDTFDGHVDRWDRDDQIRAAADAEEQKARDAMQASGTATATPTQESFVDAGALGTGGRAKDAGAKK